MPSTVVSIIAARFDILTDVVSVTLSDVDGVYGIRRKDDGEVIVAAGQPLGSASPGVYVYAFDRDDDAIYQCAFRIEYAEGVLHIVQDLYAAAAVEHSSESSSEDTASRGVDITFQPAERVFVTGEGERLRIQAVADNEVLMPRHVFAHLQRPVDPYEEGATPPEDFYFVATPYDITLYPIDAPDPEQIPGFYLKDSIDVLATSSEIAQYIVLSIQREILGLLANYARLDKLYPQSEIMLDGSGQLTDVPIDSLGDISDDPAICPAVELDDAVVLAEEIASGSWSESE